MNVIFVVVVLIPISCMQQVPESSGLTITGSRQEICSMCECEFRKGSGESAKNDVERVVFSATLTSHYLTRAGEIIKFPKVFINDGNGFNTSLGVFTSPAAGTYYFSWDILRLNGTNGLDIDFYVNLKRMLVSWTPGFQDFESRTGLMYVKLNEGDKVCLKTRQSGHYLYGTYLDVSYSTFNGRRLD